MAMVSLMRGILQGVRADTFNRSDSATTINPASDGGTWTVDAGTWGVTSNRGYMVSPSSNTSELRAYDGNTGYSATTTATGSADADVTARHYVGAMSTVTKTAILISGSANRQGALLYFEFDGFGGRTFSPYNGTGTIGDVRYQSGTGATPVSLGTFVLANWQSVTGGTLFRVTYNATTGAINVSQDGTLKGSVTAASGQRLTGGVVGLMQQTPYTTKNEYWDDFSIA